jgi:hypothetical protein
MAHVTTRNPLSSSVLQWVIFNRPRPVPDSSVALAYPWLWPVFAQAFGSPGGPPKQA